MTSFEPATRTSGLCASTATAGSFWWFSGVFPDGLPTLTSASVTAAGRAEAVANPAMKARLETEACGWAQDG